MVGILLSYWGGLFSGAMLVSGRVGVLDACFYQVKGWKSHGLFFANVAANSFILESEKWQKKTTVSETYTRLKADKK